MNEHELIAALRSDQGLTPATKRKFAELAGTIAILEQIRDSLTDGECTLWRILQWLPAIEANLERVSKLRTTLLAACELQCTTGHNLTSE